MIAAPPPGFHINLGDLPTWLGVLAASIAALFVYRQLRSLQDQLDLQREQLQIQQAEIARQVALLARQQADKIDVVPDRIRTQRTATQVDYYWAIAVTNNSNRPIREIAARLQPAEGAELVPPTKAGFAKEPGRTDWGDYQVPQLARAGTKWGFYFPTYRSEAKDAQWLVRFTDDAGLHWQINRALHLTPLGERDW